MVDPLLTKVQHLVRERQVHAHALTQIDQTLGGIRAALAGNAQNDIQASAAEFAERRKVRVSVAKTGNGKPATLADHMEAVIKRAGKPLGIADLVDGVKAAGYQSKSKNLRPRS